MRTSLLSLAVTSIAALTACKGDNITTNINDDDTGTVEAPNIVLDRREIAFGEAEDVNVLLQSSFVVQNNGQGDLNISGWDIGEPFQVPYSELTVRAGQSVQVTVIFQPDAYTSYDQSLVLTSNDPDEPEVEIVLTGSVITDRDGDGHDRPEAGGDDCDDEDAEVYPGASEEWYDGVDENCDGLDDYDQDGDGYQTSVHQSDPNRGGGDCNDVNANIYPGAADTWYDGVDSNCDSSDDFDQDGDGYASLAHGRGRDCDDSDALVYPNALERLNGRLDNCSGDRDLEVTAGAADYYYTATASNDRTGYAVAVGDIDDDGIDDIAYGSRGYSSGSGGITLVMSRDGLPNSGTDLTDASDTFTGVGSSDGLGSALHFFDDFDGDGTGDLVAGAYGTSSNYGAIYLISADDLRTGGDLNDAHTSIRGASSYYYVGRSLARADLDADGLDDLIFDWSPYSQEYNNYIYIGLLYGGNTGSYNASNVSARWTSENRTAYGYEGFADGADINGDGYEDWVFFDQYKDYRNTNDGGVYVLWGQANHYNSSGSTFYSTAEWVVTGADTYNRVGVMAAAIPDVNGDGFAELAYWHGDDGDAHLMFGSAGLRGGGTRYDDEADIVLDLGTSYNPTMFRPMADWDGDGYPEWGVAIDGNGASTPGRLFILNGFDLGEIDADDVTASIETTNDDNNTYFGHAISHRVGDVDGNGYGDLVVGDPGYDGDVNGDSNDDANAGAVYLFLNGL
ncbi:MAG: hypothetical protein H6739_16045 [Alphaproteobacteria bacterium]|nr:hypothetical protein [Alphaproteobacteria bacterium]